MVKFCERFKDFSNNRWLVFVCAMWIQSCAGIGYLFGSISPVIKSAMGYNQKQLAILGVAKDLGDAVGFVAGSLCEVLPAWGLLFIGVVQNFLGYGLLWLIVTQKLPNMPLWVVSSIRFPCYFSLLVLLPPSFFFFFAWVLVAFDSFWVLDGFLFDLGSVFAFPS